ncbi:hypothetical protein LXL04_012702 [Taraxacum kok-saghyz]
MEWSGFVMKPKLVWKEGEFRPDWIKDLDMVDGDDDIESPLSFVKNSSMVEPLGGCGKKHESKPVTCKKEMIAKGFDLHHHSNHYHRLERPRHRKNDKQSEVDARSDRRCGRRWFLFGPHKSMHPHKSSVPLRSSQIDGSFVGAKKVTGITPDEFVF